MLLRTGLRLLLLGCASLLFAASVWWDNAANRGISTAGSPPIPFTDVPQGGVNTYNLHAEVIFRPDGTVDPDNKVKRTFEMIAAAGFHWVRVQFPWEDIEVCGKNDFVDHCRAASTDGSTWAKYDYIVDQAQRNGLELIVRLDTPPAWARQGYLATPEVQAGLQADPGLTGPPDNLADFGDFVAAVAQRYRGTRRFFQIWNEPNLLREWNYHHQDPAQLVELLRVSRERIKTVNPDAVILFPALAPTDGRGNGANDLDYLQGVYDAGGRDLFDIMSAQLYGLGQPPTEHRYIKPGDTLLRPIETKADIGRVVLLHEIMVRNGDDRKAVWVSEFGWNSAPPELPQPWGAPVSEQAKGEYIVEAFQRARSEWPWMGAMCVWMFRWGGPQPDPNDPTPHFELVDFEFNPLPAYNTVKDYLTSAPAAAVPARRNPFAAVSLGLSGLLVLGSSIWLFAALSALLRDMERGRRGGGSWMRAPLSLRWLRGFGANRLILPLLALALAIFYVGSPQLPITALGGIIFLGLALLRPDLALLFVPLTVPLYLAPKGIWDARFGIRPEGIRFPLHEFVLWCAVIGSILDFGFWILDSKVRSSTLDLLNVRQQSKIGNLKSQIPMLLFFLAGTLGVAVAAARGAALREWRWLIVEPLMFYGLVRYWARDPARRWQLVAAWLITGVAVAVIGLMQLGGINLPALLPQNQCFSDRIVLADGGLRRISSVYCHPNNLALALDRVWPVLVALGIGIGNQRLIVRKPRFVSQNQSAMHWLMLGGAALCLLALGATLSKGGFLGAFVALVLLGLLFRQEAPRVAKLLLALAGVGLAGGLVLGLLSGVERLNPLGGSSEARVELWTSALRMLRDHPLTGVGLDQFYYYRTASEFGNRYIDPAARGTTEQFAAHPHNLVLDLLVRIGPLGLLAMAWLVLHFFRQSRRVINRLGGEQALAIGLIAGMGAALAHGLVDNFYFVPDLAFSLWLMLGLIDTLAASDPSPPLPIGREVAGDGRVMRRTPRSVGVDHD